MTNDTRKERRFGTGPSKPNKGQKVHYSLNGTTAYCGANQNRNIFHRIFVTNDKDAVTCQKCAKHSRSADAAGFAAELMTKLGLTGDVR